MGLVGVDVARLRSVGAASMGHGTSLSIGAAVGGGGKAGHPAPPVRTWHVLFVLGLAVQLYIFHRFEATVRCLSHDLHAPMARKGSAHGLHGAGQLRPGDDAAQSGERGEDGAVGPTQNQLLFASLEPPLVPLSEFKECHLRVVGGRASDSYGAWVLCGDHLRPHSTVYSFGIGLDISFDNALTLEGHHVYGFDPTVTAEHVQNMFLNNHARERQPPEFQFRQLGLSAEDGVVAFHGANNPRVQSKTAVSLSLVKANYRRDKELLSPVLRLATFMCTLRHASLDVLKMDVEGVEFAVCLSPSFAALLPRIGQVLIEFHERMIKGGVENKAACYKVLQDAGFAVAYVSQNKQEITFARITKDGKVFRPNTTIQGKAP